MFQEEFIKRLSTLRQEKNVSAREMSLAIGQNERYINSIENGHVLPSMATFFYICDYFKISPKDFFDFDGESLEMAALIEKIRHLDSDELRLLTELVSRLK